MSKDRFRHLRRAVGSLKIRESLGRAAKWKPLGCPDGVGCGLGYEYRPVGSLG